MIKGINKNMVVIKNVGSPLFEEAHFILKDGAPSALSRGSVLAEANRIVSKSFILSGKQSAPKRRGKAWLFGISAFLIGVAVGVAFALFLL